MKTLLRYCVGLDVSKDSLQVCLAVIDSDGRVVVKASTKVANKASSFATLLKWVGGHCKQQGLPIRYVMEATGVYHEQIAWFLYQQEQVVSVILPTKAHHYLRSLGQKSKNDTIDAVGLARMGLEQLLPLWQPLSKNIYSLRLLTRQHQRLQELKTQCLNQKHALEHSPIQELLITKQLDKIVVVYEQQMQALLKAINELIQKDLLLKNQVERLTAIKGLGLLSVATLIAETNGFEGFDNQRQLVSYAGYDVVENQSGKRVGKTRISKKGNSHIRRILHLPAFNAVRYGEPTCQALFERVYKRSGLKMKAYVAVQKKLLVLVYSIWKSEAIYDPFYSSQLTIQAKKIVPTSRTTQDEVAEASFSLR
jgi:transposase